jgi:tRNA threonylcarbamoyl adenosine modification protein (Sua5/YciO/YrdC/YwlC family)
LSNISHYAWVTDEYYRIMKHLIPGPYTFILPATKLVPKLVMNPKRKTTGIRVPDHTVCQELLKILGNPIISTSAHLYDDDEQEDYPNNLETARLFDSLDKIVDLIIDVNSDPGIKTSTILDFTESEPKVIRKGLGWDEVENWLTIDN